VVSGATFGSVSDKRLLIFSGGTASGVTVGSGGTAVMYAGGTDEQSTIFKGGTDIVSSGGVDIGTFVNSGGTEIVSAGGLASNTTVSSGGVQVVASGGTADPTVIASGGTEVISAHGTDLGAQISGGVQIVLGVASGATVFSGAQIIRTGGTADSTLISGGSAVVNAGGTALDVTIGSAGTALILSGGIGAAWSGGTFAASGSLVNSGSINVADGGTLELYSPVISNKGTINLQGVDGGAGAALLLDPTGGQVVLSGGGKIALSSSGNNFFNVGATVTLTNLENTITGAGDIGGGNPLLRLANGGIIDANTGSPLIVDVPGPVANSGIMEATASGGLEFLSTTVVNTSVGTIVATGAKAQVILFDSTIVGGTLRTSGASAVIITDQNSTSNAISGATIASGSLVVAAGNNETLALNGGTIKAGATVETLSGGHVIVTGVVTNSGALFANGGVGSLIDIAIGAVVSGSGIIKIGNGSVQIEGSGSENVTFVTGASGGLLIDDAFGAAQAYSGKITSFGGATHTNHNEIIDLMQVTSDSTVSAFYTSTGANSGILAVTSGLTHSSVAEINFVGHYVTSNFQISSGFSGSVAIFDPTVPDGGSVQSVSAQNLPNIAFGVQTTLAYSQNANSIGSTVTGKGDRLATAIALLGNYIAGSFASASDAHYTLVGEAQTQSQPLLAHPRPT